MLEQGGLYCKRCGRKVGKSAPRRANSGPKNPAPHPSVPQPPTESRQGKHKCGRMGQDDRRRRPPQGHDSHLDELRQDGGRLSEQISHAERAENPTERLGRHEGEEPKMEQAALGRKNKGKGRAEKREAAAEGGKKRYHSPLVAQPLGRPSADRSDVRSPAKGGGRGNKGKASVEAAEEAAMAAAEAAVRELDEKYIALAAQRASHNTSPEKEKGRSPGGHKKSHNSGQPRVRLQGKDSVAPTKQRAEKRQDRPTAAHNREPIPAQPVMQTIEDVLTPPCNRKKEKLAPPTCAVPLPFQAEDDLITRHGSADVHGGGYLVDYTKRALKRKGKPKLPLPPMPVDVRPQNDVNGNVGLQVRDVAHGGYEDDYEESRSLPPIAAANSRRVAGKEGQTGKESGRSLRRRGREGAEQEALDRTLGTMSAPSRLKDEGLHLPAPVRKSHDYGVEQTPLLVGKGVAQKGRRR